MLDMCFVLESLVLKQIFKQTVFRAVVFN